MMLAPPLYIEQLTDIVISETPELAQVQMEPLFQDQKPALFMMVYSFKSLNSFFISFLFKGVKLINWYETISDSCFFYQLNIYGNNLRYIDSIPTSYHCNLECKKDNGCFFFTFDFNINRCWLKTGALGTRRLESQYISGPKTCTRMIGKKIILFVN